MKISSRGRRSFAALALVLASAACDRSPTAPPADPLEISITSPTALTMTRAGGSYECEIPIQAVATGGAPGAYATWDTTYFRVTGPTGNPENFVIGPQGASLLWGDARIRSGETRTARPSITTTHAIEVSFRFVFRRSDRAQNESASLTVACNT